MLQSRQVFLVPRERKDDIDWLRKCVNDSELMGIEKGADLETFVVNQIHIF